MRSNLNPVLFRMLKVLSKFIIPCCCKFGIQCLFWILLRWHWTFNFLLQFINFELLEKLICLVQWTLDLEAINIYVCVCVHTHTFDRRFVGWENSCQAFYCHGRLFFGRLFLPKFNRENWCIVILTASSTPILKWDEVDMVPKWIYYSSYCRWQYTMRIFAANRASL